MRKVNWVEVESANFGDRLKPGGYVLEITAVEDVPSKDYLEIYYDIAEGDKRGMFRDTPKDKAWTHRFIQGYGDRSQSFFKGFLEALEASNPSFSIEDWQESSNEQRLVGLKLGAVFRNYHYISERDGQERERAEYAWAVPANDIRDGKFTIPDDRYQDGLSAKPSASSTGSDDLYDDLPFK